MLDGLCGLWAHGDVGEVLAVGKSAHIHIVVDSIHMPLVGVLPEGVCRAVGERGRILGVACDEKWIVGEVGCEVFVVE